MTVLGLTVTAKSFAFKREDMLFKIGIASDCLVKVLFEGADALCACMIGATLVTPADGMRISQPPFGAGFDA